jgi:hypothetical protein
LETRFQTICRIRTRSGADPRFARVQAQQQANPSGLGLRSDLARDRAQQLVRVEVLRHELNPLAGDPAHVEQVVDQAGFDFDVSPDHVDRQA